MNLAQIYIAGFGITWFLYSMLYIVGQIRMECAIKWSDYLSPMERLKGTVIGTSLELLKCLIVSCLWPITLLLYPRAAKRSWITMTFYIAEAKTRLILIQATAAAIKHMEENQESFDPSQPFVFTNDN